MADISKIKKKSTQTEYNIKDATARSSISTIEGLIPSNATTSNKLATAADIPSITGKADKVTSATNGNFAGLDSNGNLTDSGKKASDFMASDGVSANPTGTATGTLTKLGIGSDIYDIQGGSGADKADTTLIAPVQTTLTASKPYAVGEQFVYNQTLYKVTQAIASGAAITIGTNCELAGSVTEQLKNNKYILSRLSERKNDFETFTYTMGTNDAYYKIVQAVTDGNVKKIVFTVPNSGFYSICIQNFQTHNGPIRALLKVDNVNVESFYNYVGTEYTTLHYFNYYLKAGQVVELNFNVTDIQIGMQTGSNSFRILE